MFRSLFAFYCFVLMLIIHANLIAAEQNAEQLNEPFSDKSTSERTNDGLIESEIDIVESPLVTEQELHSRLHVSPIDVAHKLYPVKITTIDKWPVPENIFESELRLKEGEHQIIVVPDFSNISPQTVFMSMPWQEKHIAFTLRAEQDIVISARLTDLEQLLWEVQLYSVAMPAKRTETSSEY